MTQTAATAKREQALQSVSAGYDVAIVGAGVNGAGIAWECALRGMRVLLVDKGDIGSGTSSWSSKMIHGGLKYLEKYDVPLVRESLREREWLLRAAPHLVRELRFLLPFYKSNAHSANILRLGMIAYDVLSFDKSVRRFELLSPEKILEREPSLNPEGLQGAAYYSDAQVNYAERMSYEISLAAERAGATVITYAKAVQLGRTGARATSLVIRDELSGTEYTAPARVVVNAAGPWIDEVWTQDDISLPRMNGGTKGTHLVLNPFPGAPHDAFYYESQADGRPMMVIPWLDRYLIGSTDLRFTGDLDMASATPDEYEYILRETNWVIPEAHLTNANVSYAFTGVRPLPFAEGDVADITRRHDIRDHAPDIPGLYTLVGGKLTTFRQVGEDFADIFCKQFGLRRKSITHKLPLPGGGEPNLGRLRVALQPSGLPQHLIDRVVDMYGTRSLDLVQFITSDKGNSEMVDEAFGLTVGEVRWAAEVENAHRLADIMCRRTMIGLENHLGRPMVDRVAAIAGTSLGWDNARIEEELADYERYLTRFVPLS
ncbi:glycerol-3-phosphate dehydrogenase/oxidase [Propionicicella superfundia]|uniref:glycerol-3-phosphate dehydrogenase/oxidase n=1 Tax=Propionicicella superfundia TaxID=348582 RepID=UPI000429CBF3|nr:glycerol-3-phosphate dehydrogenase/oxidase [Propionicicella superfundia]